MRGVSLDHIQRLVDGAADDGVEELERILATEEVEPNEGGGGRAKLTCCQVGERRRVTQLGPSPRTEAARSRASASGRSRARRSPTTRETPCAPISSRRASALGGRAGSLPGNRVEHRADEEWVATGRRLEGGGRRSRPAPGRAARREHRDRATPKRLGANRGDLRVGDQLGDKDGIVALALGGRVPRRRGAHSLQPSRQVQQPPQGGVCPCRSSMASRAASALQGHVGREPVEAVDDREGPLRPRPEGRRLRGSQQRRDECGRP